MNDKMLFVCGLLVSTTVVSAAELAAPLAFEVSPLMKTYAGEEVKTLADWETVRRPEIRERILTRMYGKRPKAAERPPVSFAAAEPDREMLGGSAIRKRVRITSKGPYGDHAFVATAFIPKAAKPVGSFVLICNRSAIENLDPERKKISGFWPVEEIVAPRLLAIASATDDPGAGPRGEFETAHLASPVWELYGKRGLVGTTFPKPDTPLQEGFVSYHLRTGEHNLMPYDWKCYMDFADRHDWPRR